jgi:hypothetical protein
MSVPQDSKARRAEKKRRTKKLALWREKHATQATTAEAPATDEKKRR